MSTTPRPDTTAEMLLTKRQMEVVAARCEGMAFKEIAGKLNIDWKTVEYHWGKARRLIGLVDVAAMTQWALKHGVAKWVVALAACSSAMGADLIWDAPTNSCPITSYQVYRCPAGQTNFMPFKTVTGTTCAVPQGCGDVYQVAAVGNGVEGDRASTTNWVPGAVSNLRVSVTIKVSSP